MENRIDINKVYKTLISILEDREKVKIKYSLHESENKKERGNDDNGYKIQDIKSARD